MEFVSLLKLIIQKIESAGIPYMLVGSVASSFYGDPRLTRDIDLVLELHPMHLLKFSEVFQEDEFYIPPDEVVRDEVLNKRSFNLIHHETGFKIDIMIKKTSAHGQGEFLRRQMHEVLPGFEAYIASPEDIIIKKLQFYQEGGSQKHLIDCRAILSQSSLDNVYLDKWVKELNLHKEWDELSRY